MNSKVLSLDTLQTGKKGVVMDIVATETERRRFWDLGLIRGTVVESLHKSPAGDPVAYSVMGAVIALRNHDAGKILVSSNM
jgi:ferrous iron transport protein A